MPKYMERNVLAPELRHLPGCCGYGAAYDVNCTEARQTVSARTYEERQVVMTTDAALAQEILDRPRSVTSQRDHPLLATLASKHHVRTGAVEGNVSGVNVERLGNPRSCARQKEQKNAITTPVG